MKKIVLFLCLLALFSATIIVFRNKHFDNREKKIIEEIDFILEQNIEDGRKEKFQEETIGLILIPSLEVKAMIKEGTDAEILKYDVRTF